MSVSTERTCLICAAPLTGRKLRFCCRSHAMKWHNSQLPWEERKDRHRKNAERKAAYKANPEFWRNKARKWREDNPEKALLFAKQAKERYWASPWRKCVIAAKGRAQKRNIAFDLTMEWAEKRWTGFCELTQIPFSPRKEAACGVFSPSIDRVIPSKGYTQDNCRFVLFGVNSLKHDATDEVMYLIAEALLRQRELQKDAPKRLYPHAPDTDLADTIS